MGWGEAETTAQPPMNVWLTRAQVCERYGFDPEPYIVRGEQDFIASQLRHHITTEGDLVSARVYLEADVALHKLAKKEAKP